MTKGPHENAFGVSEMASYLATISLNPGYTSVSSSI